MFRALIVSLGYLCNRQVDNFKPTRAGRVKLFNRQRTIGAFSLLGTVTDFSLLTLHSGVAEVKHRVR